MNARLLNAVTLAAFLAASSAFATDSPAPMPPAPPSAMTSTMPAAAMPAAPAAAATPTAAASPSPATAMPSKPARQVSACTMSIHRAEHVLAHSKQPGATIAVAWQHLDAAKQARMSHQGKACVSESHTAAKILAGKA